MVVVVVRRLPFMQGHSSPSFIFISQRSTFFFCCINYVTSRTWRVSAPHNNCGRRIISVAITHCMETLANFVTHLAWKSAATTLASFAVRSQRGAPPSTLCVTNGYIWLLKKAMTGEGQRQSDKIRSFFSITQFEFQNVYNTWHIVLTNYINESLVVPSNKLWDIN